MTNRSHESVRQEAMTVPGRNPYKDASSGRKLRFGYTIDDLDRLSKIHVHLDTWHHGWNSFERYDLAFSAMAEYLYSCDEIPSQNDLLHAAQRAVNDYVHGDQRSRGISKSDGRSDMRGFYKYWGYQFSGFPSPEGAVIERMALRQIFPLLAPRFRRVLLTLAATSNHEQAAASLGITPNTYKNQLCSARREFLKLWHEGESPSGLWSSDHYSQRKDGSVIPPRLFNRRRRQNGRQRKLTRNDR
jgi:hypothetical protein